MAKNNQENAELTTPEVAPEAGATEATPAPTPSKRDSFRGRVSQRYPDLNMDDEDAYYDQMGSMMDEYEGYEKNSQRLRENMGKSPAMAEMLLAAREQDDFDPVVWMVQQKGLDLQAAQDDPEYADKLAQAHNDYVAKQAKGKELYEEMSKNLPESLTQAQQAMESAGMGEQFEDAVGKYFQMLDDGERGIINADLLIALAKGQSYDADVQSAREQGQAAGLNTKVDDRLRQMDARQERVAGQQTPPKPRAPKNEEKNMFLA